MKFPKGTKVRVSTSARHSEDDVYRRAGAPVNQAISGAVCIIYSATADRDGDVMVTTLDREVEASGYVNQRYLTKVEDDVKKVDLASLAPGTPLRIIGDSLVRKNSHRFPMGTTVYAAKRTAENGKRLVVKSSDRVDVARTYEIGVSAFVLPEDVEVIDTKTVTRDTPVGTRVRLVKPHKARGNSYSSEARIGFVGTLLRHAERCSSVQWDVDQEKPLREYQTGPIFTTTSSISGVDYDCLEIITPEEEAKGALDAYKKKVRSALIEEAEKRGWCGEIDAFLVKIDLEKREKIADGSVVITKSGRTAKREGGTWTLYAQTGLVHDTGLTDEAVLRAVETWVIKNTA